LRKQLAFYQARLVKPRRPDPATRVVLVLLSRLLDWHSLLTVVQPDTLIRWHRQSWRLLGRCNSRPGRPPIPVDFQRLIVTVARSKPTWGEEPIAIEVLLNQPTATGHRLPDHVRVVAAPILGGLHHEYRMARDVA
jgi:hypothetical protein